MTRPNPLPLSDEWKDPDEYVTALLSFATESVMFMNLCGGVHILDFLTRDPDLYTSLLPEDWRSFFEHHDIHSILQLLLREDIDPMCDQTETNPSENDRTWNGSAFPPASLLTYIRDIRRLSLRREFTSKNHERLPRHIVNGMNKKKAHEVEQFSRYVASLSETVHESRGEPLTHIADFGSGQNYLGRALASAPYHKHIIAIERKHQYISGANRMDVHARLAKDERKRTMHNAKLAKLKKQKKECIDCTDTPELATSESPDAAVEVQAQPASSDGLPEDSTGQDEDDTFSNTLGGMSLEADDILTSTTEHKPPISRVPHEVDTRGIVSYIEHEIKDGYLEPIIDHVVDPKTPVETRTATEEVVTQPEEKKSSDARVMVVSLHSCGNLVHHGVRSLVLNPSVVAISMVGCCYNLLTERLGPATYKIPILRSCHPRLKKTGSSWDPHGFPMSKLYEEYEAKTTKGVKLNITARAMAVQAPYNWGRADSEGFFTRHFYRALLQRVLLDHEIVPKADVPKDLFKDDPESPESGIALIVGSLRKSAFESFSSYVRAATVKLSQDPLRGEKVKERICTMTEEELQRYETDYLPTRKNLSIVWALMAFSSQVVEAAIVVDRWQFLREHDSVKECWVEPVFEYGQSPRNLAVIGIKK
jgi:Arc/MetJ-type ribon-helix-helix transcriptional regulator